MIRNPVMFVVEIVAALTTLACSSSDLVTGAEITASRSRSKKSVAVVSVINVRELRRGGGQGPQSKAHGLAALRRTEMAGVLPAGNGAGAKGEWQAVLGSWRRTPPWRHRAVPAHRATADPGRRRCRSKVGSRSADEAGDYRGVGAGDPRAGWPTPKRRDRRHAVCFLTSSACASITSSPRR